MNEKSNPVPETPGSASSNAQYDYFTIVQPGAPAQKPFKIGATMLQAEEIIAGLPFRKAKLNFFLNSAGEVLFSKNLPPWIYLDLGNGYLLPVTVKRKNKNMEESLRTSIELHKSPLERAIELYNCRDSIIKRTIKEASK